jgi:hypothetical protein
LSARLAANDHAVLLAAHADDQDSRIEWLLHVVCESNQTQSFFTP